MQLVRCYVCGAEICSISPAGDVFALDRKPYAVIQKGNIARKAARKPLMKLDPEETKTLNCPSCGAANNLR